MNMSYCRWQNTLDDLLDCHKALDDNLDGDEALARTRILHLCRRMLHDAEEYGIE
jgi:hypothetical protein